MTLFQLEHYFWIIMTLFQLEIAVSDVVIKYDGTQKRGWSQQEQSGEIRFINVSLMRIKLWHNIIIENNNRFLVRKCSRPVAGCGTKIPERKHASRALGVFLSWYLVFFGLKCDILGLKCDPNRCLCCLRSSDGPASASAHGFQRENRSGGI